MNQTESLLIALIRESLGGAPVESVQNTDSERLCKLANAHAVAPMAVPAALRVFEKGSPEARFFAAQKLRAIRADEIFRHEISVLEGKISCVRMKGAFLKDLYPQSYMRTMGDADLLIDEMSAPDAQNIMEELGYVYKNPGDTRVMAFHKPPILNIELHARMFESTGVLARLGTGHQWVKDGALTAEGHYIFLVCHLARHFASAGAGIRAVADIFVFTKAYGGGLDRAYIAKTLGTVGLADFAENLEKLSLYWFGGGECDDVTEKLSDFILSSAVYGDHDKLRLNERKPDGFLKNIVRLTFLPLEKMAMLYPVLHKAKVLLPFCWVHRIFLVLLKKRQRIAEYKDSFDRTTRTESEAYRALTRDFGIENIDSIR